MNENDSVSNVCKKIKRLCTKINLKIDSVKFSQHLFFQFFQNFQQSQQYSQQSFQQFFQIMSSQHMQFVSFSSEYVSISFQQIQIFQQPSIVFSTRKILNVSVDDQNDEKHTRFLNTIINMNEAFQLSCTIIKFDGIIIVLNKKFVQIDQRSNMNVMSFELIRHLNLILHALNEVDFRDLSMKTIESDQEVIENLYEIVIKSYCIYKAFELLSSFARKLSFLHSHDFMNLPISTIYMDDFFGDNKDFDDLTSLIIYCDRDQHYEKHLRLRSLPHLNPKIEIKS